MTLLLVLLGGAVGAVVRWAADRRLRHLDLPWATIGVNIAGCFLLGLLPGLGTALPAGAGALLGTGFCGALTTWSTFAYQSVDLVHRRRGRDALLNVSLTLAGGFAAVWLGTAVA